MVFFDVLFVAANEPKRQWIGQIAVKSLARNLPHDILLRNVVDLSRTGGEQVDDVPQFPFVKSAQPHRHDQLLRLKAESHSLHVAVKRGALWQLGGQRSLCRFWIDTPFLADLALDRHKAPVCLDVIVANSVHPRGVLIAILGHPFFQGCGTTGRKDCHFVHPDRFLPQDTDPVTLLASETERMSFGIHHSRLRFECDVGRVEVEFHLGWIDSRGELRKDVVRHLADRGRRGKRDQHPERIDITAKTWPDHKGLNTILIKHIGLLLADAREDRWLAHVDRGDHATRVGHCDRTAKTAESRPQNASGPCSNIHRQPPRVQF